MVGFDGIQILDVTGPLEVFARTSRLLQERGITGTPSYEVVLVAREPGPVATSSGVPLVAARAWRDLGPVDTLLVSGGVGTRAAMEDAELIEWLPRAARRARRFGSVCTGALLLAKAGLLAERRITTHWAFVQELADLAPSARIDAEAIFTRDDRLWTSAGVTAGMDMALAMVEEDWGRKLAIEVAQLLVMYLKRPGGLSQFSAPLAVQALAAEGRFRNLVSWMVVHLEEDLSVRALAERVDMSARNFGRCFTAEVGVTPAKLVEQMRCEAAQRLLRDREMTVEAVAKRCGFGSAETLRRVFLRRLGRGPAAFRSSPDGPAPSAG